MEKVSARKYKGRIFKNSNYRALQMQKHAELYEYAKFFFEYETSRRYRIEEKALKYLTFLSIVFTVITFIAQYLFENKSIFLKASSWHLVIVLFVITLLSIFIAWWFVFSSLRVENIERPASAQGTLVDFFIKNKINYIYLAASQEFMDATGQNKKINDVKAIAIGRGYFAIKSAIVVMAVLVVFLCYQLLTLI